MDLKINFPLIDKITSLFSRVSPPPKRREETSETSIEAGIVSYYYKKVRLEREYPDRAL